MTNVHALSATADEVHASSSNLQFQSQLQPMVPHGQQKLLNLKTRARSGSRPSLLHLSSPGSPAYHMPSNLPLSQSNVLPSPTTGDPLTILQHSTTNQPFASMGPSLNLHIKSSTTFEQQIWNHEHHYQSQFSDDRRSSERHEAVTENFSRPRQISIKGRKDSATWPHNLNNTFTPAVSTCDEDSSDLLKSHEIGLRTPTTIPDHQILEIILPKQRNYNTPSYRPSRHINKPDSNYSPLEPESNFFVLRDPSLAYGGIDGEETHSSFRSAVTTNSSFLGTSGTERSSVLTKSSSRTSLFGLDEGMSVDDAIGMYELGFTDLDEDDKYSTRPQTRSSEKIIMSRSDHDFKEFLVLPPRGHDLVSGSSSFYENFDADRSNSPIKNETSVAVIESEVGDERSPSRPMTRSATAQYDETRDIYGFRKKTQYVSLEEYEVWNKSYTIYLARRKKKWIALMRQNNLPTLSPVDFPQKSDRVKRFVRKGIPPAWRGAAWFHYAGGPAMLEKNPGVYKDLVRRSHTGDMTQTDEEIIERDLNRTFPDNIKFKPDSDPQCLASLEEPIETPILKSLRNVLRAFSIYHPKIGYCQSLNFLAGLLLLFMNEEKSFWMLNIITRIFLPGTHSLTLEGANVDLGVLMSSVKEMMPSVWAKIGNELDGQPSTPSASAPMRLPPITLCTTAWFMSCFIGTLPIETTLRVWDSFFYEGSKTLFRIALTIFKIGEPQIRAINDPMEIFQVVQGMPRGMMDCNRLMETCFKRRGGFVKLSQEDIERGREERRRGYAEERERTAAGEKAAITPGVSKTRSGTKRGNPLFGRGKKQRMGLPVQVI